MQLARQLKLPLFVSVLGTDVNRLKHGTVLARKAIEVSHHAEAIKCVSFAMREKLAALGCDRDKLVVVQNGVDGSAFFPRERGATRAELGIGGNGKIVLFVGNLKKEKGLNELALAFTKVRHLFPDVRLFVIGGGRHRNVFCKLVQRCGIGDSVFLLGEHPPVTVAQYMNACDVLCLPSYMEGQPNVILEAMACHRRVVASDVGGIPELDDGGRNLLLVPPKKVSELANALAKALQEKEGGGGWLTFNSWEENSLVLKSLFERALSHTPGDCRQEKGRL
jgi:glycosyltransferase involved in cell wall biosynthesis